MSSLAVVHVMITRIHSYLYSPTSRCLNVNAVACSAVIKVPIRTDFSSSKFVFDEDDRERTQKTANFIDCDDQSLDGTRLIFQFHLRELLQEFRLGNNARHYALVVPEEKELICCGHTDTGLKG